MRIAIQCTMRALRFTRVLKFLSVCVLIIAGMYLYGKESYFAKPVAHYGMFLNELQAEPCSIPVVDPFDISLKNYIWNPPLLVCDDTPSIVFVNENNVLHLNKSTFYYFQVKSESDIKCKAQPVLRSMDDDNVEFGDEYVLKFPAKLHTEFTFIQCNHGETVVFDNIIAGICDNCKANASNSINKQGFENETDDQISVHLIGLDSVSRSASIRGLPKTLEYLRTLGSYDFRGAMKIGENTPPNLAGLLTGRVLFTNETSSGGYVDEMPFLWKNFSAKNYATLYAEDNRNTNMLNMFTFKGFVNEPTDHYMRPFWIALKKRQFERPNKVFNKIVRFLKEDLQRRRFCEQNTKISMLTLNYLKLFMLRYQQTRKFSFTFLTDVSHRSCNNLPYIDQELKDLLQWLKEDGFMKRSVIILYGDHGSRYDALRNTYAGRIESRMPMLHVILPEHIRTRFPEMDKNLKTNTHRLVTLFDVYQTILDVLNRNYDNPSTQIMHDKPRGVSLFGRISGSRSCKDANIPSEFCACFKSSAINLTNNPQYDKVAEQLVDHINNKLSSKPKCQKLKLTQILSAEKMSLGLKHKGNSDGSSVLSYAKPEAARESYNFLIQTEPGLATFDVSFELDLQGNTPNVGNVDRTNAYGNQSYCVTNAKLRQFCYC